MIVFRIVKHLNRARDLTGIGAYYAGGRWNNEGTYAVYTSENPALALLELLVHADESELPPNLYLMSIEISDAAPILHITDDMLPEDWRIPNHLALRAMGDRIFQENQFIGFSVRSAVLPVQKNIILHPLYPDFHQQVKIVGVEPLNLDQRLL
jgi:RES domain-containing protein